MQNTIKLLEDNKNSSQESEREEEATPEPNLQELNYTHSLEEIGGIDE